MRLLINEFEKQAHEYNLRNQKYISKFEVRDSNEYIPPYYLPNYKTILTSLLLIEAQGLLDFLLPMIVGKIAQEIPSEITAFDKSWGKGNVLEWSKHVLKKELGLNYDFCQGAYSKLKFFYKVRNDQVHNGGYLSSDENRHLLSGKEGIDACKYTDLYVVEFSYCREVIDDIEHFLDQIYGSKDQ